VRPGEEPSPGVGRAGAAASRLGAGSRARASSKEKTADLQFGRTRNTSASRDKDIGGLNRTRGSSRDKQNTDLKFGQGTSAVRGSASKERLGLNFGKAAEAPKLDPNQTVVDKKELKSLQDSKEENDKNKEELYNLNIKYKKLDFQLEQLKRDHKDELETLTHDLNEKHTAAH